MQIQLKFVELHAPLFLAGTNLGLKLDPNKRSGITMLYDREEKELLVFFNDDMAIIPTSNVASMSPVDVNALGIKIEVPKVVKAPTPAIQSFPKASKAQVSTPTSHVFEGETKGQR